MNNHSNMLLTAKDKKLIRALRQKKVRKEHGLFIAEGPKVVGELLQSSFEVEKLICEKGNDATQYDIEKTPVFELEKKEFEKLSNFSTPNEVLCVVKIPRLNFDITAFKNAFTLVFDEIKDPGNLGTVIRIADWFGVKNIICSTDSVDAYNPKTVQASMGSIARVNMFYEDLVDVISQAKEHKIKVIGAALGGKNAFEQKLETSFMLVFGSESHGISEQVTSLLDEVITIPNYGGAESLNVAVSTGILCAEYVKLGA